MCNRAVTRMKLIHRSKMVDVPGDQYASDDEDEEDADDRYPRKSLYA